MSVCHYAPGDLDGDGVRDTLDNCLRASSGRQVDLDGNGVGLSCDSGEFARLLLPALDPALL